MAEILFIDRALKDASHHVQVARDLGHVVELIGDCEMAYRSVERVRPDAIVVGRLADDILRYDLCRQLRQIAPVGQSVIIALVPASARLSRIRCLEEGADGVIDDDSTLGHLWARINSFVSPRIKASGRDVLVYGQIKMDIDRHKATAAGLPLALNRTSFAILRHFLENPEQALTRQDISSALGRAGLHRERTIDVHIRTLRLAMKPGGAGGLVVTVPQSGYMLCDRAICDCRSVATTAGNRAVAR